MDKYNASSTSERTIFMKKQKRITCCIAWRWKSSCVESLHVLLNGKSHNKNRMHTFEWQWHEYSREAQILFYASSHFWSTALHALFVQVAKTSSPFKCWRRRWWRRRRQRRQTGKTNLFARIWRKKATNLMDLVK